MESVIQWILDNKSWEWAFSGICVVILGWVGRWVFKRKSAPEPVKNVQAGYHEGDVIQGDTEKKTIIKNSKVGIVGDNVKVDKIEM